MKPKLNLTLAYFLADIKLDKLSFINLFILVTIIKIAISAVLVLIIEYMEIGNLWSYKDFYFYNSGNKTGPNFLYSIFIEFIKADSLSNPILITLACISSGLIDTLCIYFYSSKYQINRQIIIMYLIFCFHPYFSFYTFRFDTIFFGKIACVFFLGQLFFKGKINSELSNSLILFFSMFRLSNLVFLLASIFSDTRLMKLDVNKNFIFSSLIFLTFAYFLFTLNIGYADIVMATPTTYGWSIEDSQNLFGTFGLALDNIIVYTLKTLVLFGGREAIYIYQFNYFENSNYPIFEYVVFFVLALFNIICLGNFILFAKRNKFLFPILISLSLLVLSILTVAHMRYLVVFYPMLLIGWISLGQNNKKRCIKVKDSQTRG